MKTRQPMTRDHFIKRLSQLCLQSGLSEFPKSAEDQHILLQSAALSLRPDTSYSEQELGAELNRWITDVTRLKFIDHVTLRRGLVDAGYLLRNRDGSCYRLAPFSSRAHIFEGAVQQVDVAEVLEAAGTEIARSKEAYINRQTSEGKLC